MGLRRTRERHRPSTMEWWLDRPRWVRLVVPMAIIVVTLWYWHATGILVTWGLVGAGTLLLMALLAG